MAIFNSYVSLPEGSFFLLGVTVSPLRHRTVASSFQQETTPQAGSCRCEKIEGFDVMKNPQQWD